MTLKALQAEQHLITLTHRSIQTFLQTSNFMKCYEALSKTEKETVSEYARHGQKELLVEFVQVRIKKEIIDMTVRELRRLAQQHYILGYSRLLRCELITELETRICEKQK